METIDKVISRDVQNLIVLIKDRRDLMFESLKKEDNAYDAEWDVDRVARANRILELLDKVETISDRTIW